MTARRSSRSFEKPLTVLDWERHATCLHEILKRQTARVLAYGDLIEAHEIRIAELESSLHNADMDALEQGEQN